MYLAPGQSQSIRSLFRDEYDGGFHKPCTANELRVVVDPPELATISGGSITWAKAGSGKITGEVVYSDGVVRPAAGELVLVCGEMLAPVQLPAPDPVEVVRAPALQRAVMVDPDA